ncbi:MAG TPA: TOBE domain-containing protein, partial [bacterium]|nr:TOBE domain-containing protein [bacterium]
QRDVGVTTVLVTHDQEEALALSDRVVVMNHGRAEQVGPPDAVYRRPRSPFVAEFLGAKNMWDGVVTMRDGPVALIRTADFEIAAAVPEVREPTPVVVIVRPEAISIVPDDRAAARTGRNRVAGEVRSVQYLGAWIEYIVQVGSTHIRLIAQNREGSSGAPDPSLDGGRVILEWSAAACHVIPPA